MEYYVQEQDTKGLAFNLRTFSYILAHLLWEASSPDHEQS